MLSPPVHRYASRGVTLLEVVTAFLVIAILVVISLPVFAQLQRRAEKTVCINNLRQLHAATNLYMQDHHGWPQIKTKGVESNDLATSWINTLQPYGLTQNNWICPTIQRNLQNPDLTDHNNTRVDYTAMPFDSNPQTPFRWSTMPWYVEAGDEHGNGNLILYPDGHVQELGDLLKSVQPATHPATAP